MNAADAWKDGWANALVFIHDAHEWKLQRDEAVIIGNVYDYPELVEREL